MIAEKSLIEHPEVLTVVTRNVLVAKEGYCSPMYIMNVVIPLPGNDCSRRIVDWFHPLPLFPRAT
jgi:hypothetical protein